MINFAIIPDQSAYTHRILKQFGTSLHFNFLLTCLVTIQLLYSGLFLEGFLFLHNMKKLSSLKIGRGSFSMKIEHEIASQCHTYQQCIIKAIYTHACNQSIDVQCMIMVLISVTVQAKAICFVMSNTNSKKYLNIVRF